MTCHDTRTCGRRVRMTKLLSLTSRQTTARENERIVVSWYLNFSFSAWNQRGRCTVAYPRPSVRITPS